MEWGKHKIKLVTDDGRTIFDDSNERLEYAKNYYKKILIIGINEYGECMSDSNMTNAEAIFSMEDIKFRLFADELLEYGD